MNTRTAAITTEEWARIEAKFGEPPYPIVVDREWATDPERHRQAFAALALLGQPFGFTWEDVDLLRFIADKQHALGVSVSGLHPFEQVAALADRIAALLPPRE